MPRGWRITKPEHAARAFDGEGARKFGGRWNSPGTPAVYTAQSEALAALELLVHLQSNRLLMSYMSIPVDFPAAFIEGVDPSLFSRNWKDYPAPLALQRFGDLWAAQRRSVVLEVPSVVVPGEVNYILNPSHPDFPRVEVGQGHSFQFDPRLKK